MKTLSYIVTFVAGGVVAMCSCIAYYTKSTGLSGEEVSATIRLEDNIKDNRKCKLILVDENDVVVDQVTFEK